VQTLRGWCRGLRRAVGRWYTARPPGELADQGIKYQSRDGWSHRDLLWLGGRPSSLASVVIRVQDSPRATH
jgi:60 kDa SS-A/Ro ribonucleoprotein